MILLLPDPWYSDLRAHLCEFEGRINFCYLDGPGNVTCGVGHLLPDFATACAVVPGLTQAEWDAVKASPPNQVASAYRDLTKARMTEESMDGILDTDIEIKGRELGSVLPVSAQAWPGSARQAMYEFAFNIGPAGLVAKFPRMLAAIEAGDYKTAALESGRKGIQPERNRYVYDLLMSA